MKLFSISLGYGIAVAVARDLDEVVDLINNHDEIVFGYPVQYSAVPKYLSDFIHNHSKILGICNVLGYT